MPVDASDGELAGASEEFADVTGAEAGVAPVEAGTTVVDVEVGQLGVVVVVDVGVVVEVVDVGLVVEVVDVEVVEVVVVEVVDVEVVDVGVVVEVVDVEVVVEVGQLGVVVEVVEVVVVFSVVGIGEGSVVEVVEGSVVAVGSGVDDALAPLPPAGSPPDMTAPMRVRESSPPTLHLRNLDEPSRINTIKTFTHEVCPKADWEMNSPRPAFVQLRETLGLLCGHRAPVSSQIGQR
jgi:hypothetical protein